MMLLSESDKREWAESIKKYQHERKEKTIEPSRNQYITYQEVKKKEIEYHPILQKYKEEEKESNKLSKDLVKIKKDQSKILNYTSKYDHNFDIITIENRENHKDNEPKEKAKRILMSSNQVDYNIITNNKLDETLHQNYDKIPAQIVYKPNINLKFNVI